jgi:single-strand DNA-binding protein
MLVLTISGNLGRDPELKTTDQSQVASFSVGVRTGKDETTWVNCSVWGKRADTVMAYFKRGSKVTLTGSGKLRSYENKNGTQGSSLEMNVTDFTLPAREGAATSAAPSHAEEVPF